MVSVSHQTIATGDTLAQVTRPARTLIGWMQQQDAQLILAQRRARLADQQKFVDQASNARATVAARPAAVEVQQQTLTEPAPELADYVGRFMGQPDCRQYVA